MLNDTNNIKLVYISYNNLKKINLKWDRCQFKAYFVFSINGISYNNLKSEKYKK